MSPLGSSSQISSWLEELSVTPPRDEEGWLLKRATSESTDVRPLTAMSTYRSVSPSKRQRRDSDDLQPEQSTSAVRNARPLIMGSSSTFSPPTSRGGTSTPRRSNCPSHKTIVALKAALPPITMQLLNGAEPEPPARVLAVIARFEKGLDHGWIPG